MECKDCKVVCDGKEVAVITCTDDGVNIKCTDEGKTMCGQFFADGKGCCK